MAKRKKQPLYKSRIEKLNKIGVTSLSSTRKQSRKTQARVNRLWREYGHVANNADEYATRKVNKERAKLFKELDYPVIGDRVYIYNKQVRRDKNKKVVDDVTYNKIRIRYEKINGKKRTVLVKETKGKTYKNLIIPPNEILDELNQFDKARLNKGEFLTVQIGNLSPFSTRFRSFEQLLFYVENKFTPQQPLKKSKRRGKRAQAKLRNELIQQMTIVKYKQ